MLVMYIFASMPRLHEVDDADDDEKNESAEHSVIFCYQRHQSVSWLVHNLAIHELPSNR